MENVQYNLLNKGFSKKVKSLSRHPLCNMEMVSSSTQFEIANRMFYSFDNYHKIAHGTYFVEKWPDMIMALGSFGNNGHGSNCTILKKKTVIEAVMNHL